MDIPRISARELRGRMLGERAPLLVCAYDSEERFREMELEGAISWESLRSALPWVSKDREIVLYCA